MRSKRNDTFWAIEHRNASWYTAVHEAGHAVVGLVQGFVISMVSIDPDVCLGEPSELARNAWSTYSRRPDIAYVSGAFQADVNDVIRPLVESGELRTREDRELVRRYCAMFVAGGLTEQAYGGKITQANVALDKDQIASVLLAVVPLEQRRTAIVRRAISEANAVIQRHPRAIEAIADNLVERGTLVGPEVVIAAGLDASIASRSQ